jgi:hypothetical protein
LFFDLHGEEDWVSWAGRTLMPDTVEDIESKRRLAEQVRRESERVEAERARMEEEKRNAEAKSKAKSVSAHAP